MKTLPRLVHSDSDFDRVAQNLKFFPCPHCHHVGTLIRHGFLFGYDPTTSSKSGHRAQRVFCSNRHQRQGCGRTVTVWFADKIRYRSLSTVCLWQFLSLFLAKGVKKGVMAAIRAIRAIRDRIDQFSERTWLRVWRRFRDGLSDLRTQLRNHCCPPPQLPNEHRPEAETIEHLQVAFPGDLCPFTAFQLDRQTFCI